jgi:hypothetical protein
LFRHLFGIGEAWYQETVGKHHRSGHHRTGQGPPACFIQPCDTGKAGRAYAPLKGQGIARQLVAEQIIDPVWMRFPSAGPATRHKNLTKMTNNKFEILNSKQYSSSNV